MGGRHGQKAERWSGERGALVAAVLVLFRTLRRSPLPGPSPSRATICRRRACSSSGTRCSSSTRQPAGCPVARAGGRARSGAHATGWQFGAGRLRGQGPWHRCTHPETALHHRGSTSTARAAHARGHAVGLYYDTTHRLHGGLLDRVPSASPSTGAGWGNCEHRRARSVSGGTTTRTAIPPPRTANELVDRWPASPASRTAAAALTSGVSARMRRPTPSTSINLRVADCGRPDVLRLRGRAVRLGLLVTRPEAEEEQEATSIIRHQHLAVLLRHEVLPAGPRAGSHRTGPGFLEQRDALTSLGTAATSYVRPRERPSTRRTSLSSMSSPSVRRLLPRDGRAPTGTKPHGSNVIRVDVVARLSAGINDQTLKPGQKAVITGKIGSGRSRDQGHLGAQGRQRLGQASTRTKTSRGGSFNVSTKATRVGTMVLRLRVAAPGKGIEGAFSTWIYVDVTPKPQPKPPPTAHWNPGSGGHGRDDVARPRALVARRPTTGASECSPGSWPNHRPHRAPDPGGGLHPARALPGSLRAGASSGPELPARLRNTPHFGYSHRGRCCQIVPLGPDRLGGKRELVRLGEGRRRGSAQRCPGLPRPDASRPGRPRRHHPHGHDLVDQWRPVPRGRRLRTSGLADRHPERERLLGDRSAGRVHRLRVRVRRTSNGWYFSGAIHPVVYAQDSTIQITVPLHTLALDVKHANGSPAPADVQLSCYDATPSGWQYAQTLRQPPRQRCVLLPGGEPRGR